MPHSIESESSILDLDALQKIKAVISSNPECSKGWEAFDIQMRAFDLPGLDATRENLVERARTLGGRKVYTYSNFLRVAIAKAAELAFHYRMTESPSSLEGAKKIFSYLLDEPVWRAQGQQHGWISDLWTADYSLSAGLVFGHIASTLDAAEQKRWATVIYERGVTPVVQEWIDPSSRIHALDTMGHNWWSVCVGGAAIALFAIRRSVPDSEVLLGTICESFVEFFNYPGNILQNKKRTFGKQGDFIESLGYLDYTLHNMTLFFELCRKHLGRDLPAQLPFLEKVCDYYMASVQPLKGSLQRLNFGDMGSGANTMGSYNHQPSAVWLWLAKEFGRNDLFHLVREVHPSPSSFLDFLFWPTDLSGESYAGAPGDSVFENIGVGVLRDGYTPESTVFAIKTGEDWNHNQADAGSFILSSGGVEFFSDPGTTEYSSSLHGSYFIASEAHNVVLHNGRGQDRELNYLGTKFAGTIPTWIFTPGYRYLLADATGPWQGIYSRNYRHVLWIDDFILLVDDLMAHETGDWTSLLHYEGEAKVSGNQVRITNAGKALTLHLLAPEPREFEVKTGYRSQIVPSQFKFEYEVTEQPYLAVHLVGNERREKILQLIELPDGARKKVETIHGENMVGVRVSSETGVWEIYCNHLADGRVMHCNSAAKLDHLRTDAFICAHHRNEKGELDRVSLHNGSYLFIDEKMIYSALIKSDVAMTFEKEEIAIHSHLSAPTWATLHACEPVQCPIPNRWNSGKLRVLLPAGHASNIIHLQPTAKAPSAARIQEREPVLS